MHCVSPRGEAPGAWDGTTSGRSCRESAAMSRCIPRTVCPWPGRSLIRWLRWCTASRSGSGISWWTAVRSSGRAACEHGRGRHRRRRAECGATDSDGNAGTREQGNATRTEGRDVSTKVAERTRGGVGESVRRVDGVPKVKGQFLYGSDLWAEEML